MIAMLSTVCDHDKKEKENLVWCHFGKVAGAV